MRASTWATQAIRASAHCNRRPLAGQARNGWAAEPKASRCVPPHSGLLHFYAAPRAAPSCGGAHPDCAGAGAYNARLCGCSSMVERQLPKLHTRVRFPSPAPVTAFSLWLNAFSLFPLVVLVCPACVARDAACLRSFAPLQPGCYSGAGGAQGTNAPFHAGVVLSMVLGVFGL